MLTEQDQIILTSLEIIVSLLVFGVGIPSLIFDRPQWLRRIRDGHSNWAWYPGIAAIILGVVAVILASFIMETPTLFGCDGQSAQPTLFCPAIHFARRHAHTIAGVLVIFSFGVTFGLWWRLRSYRTQYVVKRLNDIAQGKDRWRRFVRRAGFRDHVVNLDERKKCFTDLGTIGRAVEIEADRGMVLETLSEFAKGDFLFDSDGEDFPLLRIYCEAVLKAAAGEHAVDYMVAIEIMKTLMTKVNQRKDYSVTVVSAYLNKLGRSVLLLEDNALDFALVESDKPEITYYPARPLFDWITLALELGRDISANTFVHRLQIQVDRTLAADQQSDYFRQIAPLFVGAIAHFSTKSISDPSDARREAALTRLNVTFGHFDGQMEPLFEQSVEFFKAESDFVTADRVGELQREYTQRLAQQWE